LWQPLLQHCADLTSLHLSDRDKLHKIKNLKEQLKRAKLDLQRAERNGDLARAGELAYGIIPTLERQLPKEYVHSLPSPDDLLRLIQSLMTSRG
jgi:hypothetical protein